jgi:hypothetical protein
MSLRDHAEKTIKKCTAMANAKCLAAGNVPLEVSQTLSTCFVGTKKILQDFKEGGRPSISPHANV